MAKMAEDVDPKINGNGAPRPSRLHPHLKRVDTSERAANREGVDFVRALVGVHRFQVEHVPDGREFQGNPGGAVNRTRHAGNFQRLPHAVFLRHADLEGRQAVLIFQAGEVVIHDLGFGDFQGHLDQLFLDQLFARDGHTELDALPAVGQGRIKTGFGCAHGAPRNAEACLV